MAKTVKELMMFCSEYAAQKHDLGADYPERILNKMTRLEFLEAISEAIEERLQDHAQEAPPRHSDDIAVDKFAAAMKAKLAEKRSEGRSGWEDKNQCSIDYLLQLFYEQVDKGDPVDVANLSMMLWHRIEATNLKGQEKRLPQIRRAKAEKALHPLASLRDWQSRRNWNT